LVDVDRLEAVLVASARARRSLTYAEVLAHCGVRITPRRVFALCRDLGAVCAQRLAGCSAMAHPRPRRAGHLANPGCKERCMTNRWLGDSIDNRLAVYGTLAPGRPNHHLMSNIPGTWIEAIVRGRLQARGWGADIGYPGIIPAKDGDDIAVQLFVSPKLPSHLAHLDAFEGEDYERVAITTFVDGNWIEAWIYALRGDRDDPAG
jgi:gamma-glutamylcyclotransferase (GGCT)/AIG2-like uncharacterized protein YtfP